MEPANPVPPFAVAPLPRAPGLQLSLIQIQMCIRDRLATVLQRVACLELAADDAGLAPHLTRLELAIGGQAGNFGAGTGAAGRAVVGFAGAQHVVCLLYTSRCV